MKRCKRCGSPNCLLKEDLEVKCVLCGYVNETLPSPPEDKEFTTLVAEVLREHNLDLTHLNVKKKDRRHSFSPSYGGATTQNGVWSQ